MVGIGLQTGNGAQCQYTAALNVLDPGKQSSVAVKQTQMWQVDLTVHLLIYLLRPIDNEGVYYLVGGGANNEAGQTTMKLCGDRPSA